MIERGHPRLSIRQQWCVAGRHRSSLDEVPVQASEEHRWLLPVIDEPDTRDALVWPPEDDGLAEGSGDGVNRQRVLRLMGASGLEALYPRPQRSAPGPEPRGIRTCSMGWRCPPPTRCGVQTITSIPRRRGAWSGWPLSTGTAVCALLGTLQHGGLGCCLVALEGALERWGSLDLFNSDQGVQLHSRGPSQAEGGGRGGHQHGWARERFDHIFVERLWRTVK